MPLNETQKKHLRRLAHALKPVVMVGQHGLRESVHAELEQALMAHELVKVKVSVGDRELRDRLIGELVDQSGAELVQRIGNMAILFRRNPKKPRIELPRGRG